MEIVNFMLWPLYPRKIEKANVSYPHHEGIKGEERNSSTYSLLVTNWRWSASYSGHFIPPRKEPLVPID